MRYKIETKGKLGDGEVTITLEGNDIEELTPMIREATPLILELLEKKGETP